MVYLESSVRLKVTWRGLPTAVAPNGPLLTPDSQEWNLYDSKGELQETWDTEAEPATGPEGSEGVYYVDYTVTAESETGIWKLIATCTKDERSGITPLVFEVEAP